MPHFNIIPVIDILNSKAVHAIKGERTQYRPLKSVLFDTNDPKIIVKKLISIGFNNIYIADLDAIMHNTPNINLLKEILDMYEANIILDPGIKNLRDIRIFSELDLPKLIIGLETVGTIDVIIDSLKITSENKIIVSVDMYKERIKTRCPSLKDMTVLQIIKKLNNLGVNQIILLDLFRIGQKLGGIPELYLKIRDKFIGKIIVGGGIRNLNDIKYYQKMNFAGVLIGTALHDGSINYKDLISF